MTQTTNYQLPQWGASDRVKRGDFNSAMSKIDTQMKANANNINTKAASSTVTSLQTTVSSLQTTVSNKADKSTVTALQTTVNGKADSSAVQTALAGKADASDLTALQTTVAGKADASALDAKADASAVSALQTTVNGKADSSAVSALQTTVAEIAASVAAKGNAKIEWGSYVGNGNHSTNTSTMNFDFCPVLVILWSQTPGYYPVIFLRGTTIAYAQKYQNTANTDKLTCYLTWEDNAVTRLAYDASSQFNYPDTTYYYVALGYDLPQAE